jgi:hypothetical protein
LYKMAATNHELELQYFRDTLESFDGYAQYHVRPLSIGRTQ